MRTVSKNEEKQGVVNEFNLKESFVLWKNKSEKGNDYLKGYTPNKETILVGFFNSNKKNPNEPDVRIYSVIDGKQDLEVASLWENISKSGDTRYFSGQTNDNEKLVGFYSKEKDEKKPYIRVYYKEN